MEERKINCLDKGFVRLVDWMGNDEAIVQAARVSYGKGTKSVSEDRGLIRYLVRNKHTSPLEMVEFKFHCKMPIFIARQWVRHRTASLNEMSGRYSEMPDECYIPDVNRIKEQSTDNKQGSGDELEMLVQNGVLEDMIEEQRDSFDLYHSYLERNVARELARINLPLSTYTEWYWKMDLHNLFHFLRLRLHQHAQYEIRVYAKALYDLIKPIVPIACEAFEDYVLNAVTFSWPEMEILLERLHYEGTNDLKNHLLNTNKLSKRELNEFFSKLEIINEK